MHLSYQRGELSLVWTAVFVALFALIMMALLFSWRYERNLFAEGWSRLMHTAQVQTLQQTAERVKPDESAVIRKCTINGKLVYSNVECNEKNATSHKVELHDTHGIEQPKAPPALPTETDAPGMLKNKTIEQAISR